jgi:hypothetical protein
MGADAAMTASKLISALIDKSGQNLRRRKADT